MRFLYLDFDEPLDVDALEKRIEMISELTDTDLELREVYPTARGAHAVVAAQWKRVRIEPTIGEPYYQMPKSIEPVETVCLQLLLGSDPKREAFNLVRAHSLGDAPGFWRDRWNILFSEKLPEG